MNQAKILCKIVMIEINKKHHDRMKISVVEINYQDTWPIRQKVMWPEESIEFVKLPKDRSGKHFGLKVDRKIISIVSLFINNQEAQFRKFATLTQHQGQGYGTTLLTSMMKSAESHQIKKIWCNARVDKISFYEKFGMKPTKNIFSKHGKKYVIMEKSLIL